MNSIFKVIYNKSLGRLVVASELARGYSKMSSGSSRIDGYDDNASRYFFRFSSVFIALILGLSPFDLYAQGTGLGITATNNGAIEQDATTRAGSGQDGFRDPTSGVITGSVPSSYYTPGNLKYNYAYLGGRGSPDTDTVYTSAFLQSISLGKNAIGGEGTVAGGNAKHTGIALGDNSYAVSGAFAMALGIGSRGDKIAATALGYRAAATGINSLAMMRGAQATQNFSIAIGTNALSSGLYGVSLGREAETTGTSAVAIGSTTDQGKTLASSEKSVAMGSGAQAKGNLAVAMGYKAKALADKTISIGSNEITAENSGALGNQNKISGTNSYAMGANNKIDVSNSFAVGNNVTVTQANSVVLGNASDDRAATSETSATVGSLNFTNFAGVGAANKGVISVGSSGQERQLINAAAGKIAAGSTDAINGSQLYSTTQTMTRLADSVKDIFGGNAQVNPDGSITFTDIGGTDKATIHEAILAARSEVKAGTNIANIGTRKGVEGQTIYKVNAKYSELQGTGDLEVVASSMSDGNVVNYTVSLTDAIKQKIDTAYNAWNVQTNGDTADKVALGETVQFLHGDNILITRNGKDITVATKEDVSFNKMTVNDQLTVGPVKINSSQINAGGKQITNVAEAKNDTDAINVAQMLKVLNKALSDSGNMSYFKVQERGAADNKIEDQGILNFVDGTGTTAAVTSKENAVDVTFDLTQETIDSLAKADTSLATIKTQIDGTLVNTLTSTNNAANFITGDNIILTEDGGGINIALSSTPTFKSLNVTDSLTVGNVKVDGRTNTIGGLTERVWAPDSIVSGQAATETQLKAAIDKVNSLTPEGTFGFTADDKRSISSDLDTTINIKGEPGAIKTSVVDDQMFVELIDKNKLTAGDNLPGTISVKGKDGKDGVRLDGASGTIGLAGKDGSQIDLGVKRGQPGVDGSVQDRLTVAGGEVATLNDGLKFAANTGTTHNARLNTQVDVKGAQANTQWADFDQGKNIMTQVTPGTVTIALAKDLAGLNSLTLGEGDNQVKFSSAGLEFLKADGAVDDTAPRFSRNGIDAADKQVTGVASGLGDIALPDAQGDTLNNVINIGDLKNVINDMDQLVNSMIGGFGVVAQDGKKIERALGEAIDVVGDKKHINTQVKDGAIQIELSNNLDLGEVGNIRMGDTSISKDGIKVGDITLTQSGINAGDKQLSGVKAGDVTAGSKDAVSGFQVFDLTENINQRAAEAKTEVVAGKNVTVTSSLGDKGQTVYTVDTADNVDFDTVTVGDVVIDATTNKITGLTNGAVNPDSTDIVNGSQLFEVEQLPKKLEPKIKATDVIATDAQKKVTTLTNKLTQTVKRLDGGIKLFADAGDVTYHKLDDTLEFIGDGNLVTETTGDGIRVKLGKELKLNSVTVDNGPNLSDKGFDASNTPITNIASGLGNVYDNVADNHAASIGDANTIVANANLDKLRKQLNAGTATGLAAAGLPQAYLPGHSMLAVAAGTYRDQHAIAIGVSRISDGGRMLVKGNIATNTASESTVSVGVGLLW